VSFPAFKRYYEDAKTASAHLSAFAFRSALITPVAFSFLAIVDEKRARDLGSCYAGMIRSGFLSEETVGSPSFPGDPIHRYALLSDPGRTSMPYQNGTSVLPPQFVKRRLLQSDFFEAQ